MLDVGTRYDPRNGTYKLLDVNPRIGSTFRLFVDNDGMDVVRAFYLDMTGQAIPAGGFPEGRKWIVEDADLFGSLRQRSSGSLSLMEWARSLRGVREGGYFSWKDPLPFIVRVFSVAGIALKRLFRKGASCG
jgi:predicted ATP-grasp superfamily ATP-dependent carboligase